MYANAKTTATLDKKNKSYIKNKNKRGIQTSQAFNTCLAMAIFRDSITIYQKCEKKITEKP